jgi:actin-related protein
LVFFRGAEKKLKAAKALKEKGETPEELLQSIKENEAAVAEAQRTVDAWKAIVGEKSHREEAAKAEAERIATEKAEAERKAAEERERAEKEEKARIEAEKKETERIATEKTEEEARVEAERKAEEERIAKQKMRRRLAVRRLTSRGIQLTLKAD